MAHLTEMQSASLQQPLRRAALRRNMGTAAIVVVAFSGGPFGLTWLATSSAAAFTLLMLWRFNQQRMTL